MSTVDDVNHPRSHVSDNTGRVTQQKVAERWQRWQKGFHIVRIPFLCYRKQGSGERAITEAETKRKPRRVRAKKKEKAGGLFWYSNYTLIITYSALFVKC